VDGFTIPVAGFYQVDLMVTYAGSNTTGVRGAMLTINGNGNSSSVVPPASGVQVCTVTVGATLFCDAGNVLRGAAYQTSGAALALSGNAAYTRMTVHKVPAPVINGAAASGVWGAAPLVPAKAGTDDLAGEVIYIDSKGQLRGAPPRLDTPHCARNKTTTQNLTAASTYYTVIFEDEDTPSVGITYSGGVFTVPEDGIYQLDLNLLGAGSATPQMRVSITTTNPSEGAVNRGQPAWNNTGNSMLGFGRSFRMKAGATLTISAWANATGQGITGSSANYSTMSLTKIAP